MLTLRRNNYVVVLTMKITVYDAKNYDKKISSLQNLLQRRSLFSKSHEVNTS